MHPILKFLQNRRHTTGQSLAQLSPHIGHGVTPVALGSWERGDRRPTLETAELWANSLGYTITALPTGVGTDIEAAYARGWADATAAMHAATDRPPAPVDAALAAVHQNSRAAQAAFDTMDMS